MLSAEESRQLDWLSLGSMVGAPALHAAGTRVARARGLGAEYGDFRPYQPGDDPRSIDWTIHARLRQLVVRVRRADARLRLHLLVDASASMGAGMPDKLSCATRLAAIICYIALRQRDAVGIALFGETITKRVAPVAGRQQMHRVFETLAGCAAAGRSAIDRALTDYGNAVHGPGLVVVISDFFQETDTRGALRYLRYRGLTPAVVQVVTQEELDPTIDDEVELQDLEDPGRPPLVVDRGAVAAYQARVAALSGDLGEFCATHGLPSMRIDPSWPFERWLQACVHSGLLAGHGADGR